jgi:hypothetical protein
MTVGDVIVRSPVNRHVTARLNRLGPRKAMGEALAAFLLGLSFRVDGADDRDQVFQLAKVRDHWPDPRKVLEYPSASIVDIPGMTVLPHNFTPTALEETWGTFDELAGFNNTDAMTVLWKESGARCAFQVDFWAEYEAQRQAIEAAIPGHFSPEDGRSGVLVEGPELYYSRPMRFTVDTPRYDDNAATAFVQERRLRCVVTGECDIVTLRMATEQGQPRICVDIVDPNDPAT